MLCQYSQGQSLAATFASFARLDAVVAECCRILSTLLDQGGCCGVQIRLASRQAGVATASMGKFDERVVGEKPGERQLSVKRRKFEPVVGNVAGEKAKVSLIVHSSYSP